MSIDRLNITIAVEWDVKPQTKPNKNEIKLTFTLYGDKSTYEQKIF